MSLHNEKQSKESLILIYETTHSESFSLVEGLEKVIQLGWFGTPTNSSPSLLLELGIEQIVDQDGFWMKMTQNLIESWEWCWQSNFFFQMFYEKIFRSLVIILSYCLQMNELIEAS